FDAQPREPMPNPPYPKDGWFLIVRESGDKVAADVHSISPAAPNGPGSSTSGVTEAKVGDWVPLEISTEGNQTRVRIGGWSLPPTAGTHTSGVLSLWNNGTRDAKIAFRNIEVKDLAPKSPVYKDDRERLQGKWLAEAVEVEGKHAPPEMRDQVS